MSKVGMLALCVVTAIAGSTGCAAPEELDEIAGTDEALLTARSEGRQLFERETFGGNGRTCRTCHDRQTGTLSIEQIQTRFAEHGTDDPLFRAIDSDDQAGLTYDRMLEHGTVLIRVPLPPFIHLLDDFSATSMLVARGIPSTLNTPGLDPVLMYDGRHPTLEAQALGAVHDHTENTREPTAEELALLSDFQETETFYSNPQLRNFFRTGEPPTLPPGETESERRGRVFIAETDFAGSGRCGRCHSGPMLNEIGINNPRLPQGSRFDFTFAGFTFQPQPLRVFVALLPDQPPAVFAAPELGRMHVTNDPNDLITFKIPTLWGAQHTAPYFHDNSAKNLDEMLEHYSQFFVQILGEPPLSAQDREDIKAYMQLL